MDINNINANNIADLRGLSGAVAGIIQGSPGRRRILRVIVAAGFLVTLIPLFLMMMFMSANGFNSKKGCTEKVSAQVIENLEEQTEDLKDKNGVPYTTYRPVFSFEYGGETYVVESNFGEQEKRYETGTSLDLMIDPNDPKHYYNPAEKAAKNGIYKVLLVFPIGYLLIVLSVRSKVKKVLSALGEVGRGLSEGGLR